ncbi:hypothetical protein [Methanococcoides vulcani]|nr:hypothetical protein [Methanococcoides vulcani]
MKFVLLAYFGGLAINFIRLLELQTTPKAKRTPTFSDWLYTVQFFGGPLVGSFLAWAYYEGGMEYSPILIIHVGVSAPLIMKSFAGAIPTVGKQTID